MVTNIVLNKIDKHVPPTLSCKDINLLRKNLGFNGGIVTDSLSPRAVQHYCDVHDLSADYEAIKAGSDMITSDYAHR